MVEQKNGGGGWSKGMDAMSPGRSQDAVDRCRQQVREQPYDARAQSRLGLALWHRGEREDGLHSMVRALELDANDREVVYDSCRIFESAGRRADARDVLEAYVDRNPWDEEAASRLSSGFPEEAPRPESHNFDPAPFFVTQGEIQFEQGRRERARMCFEMALESDPSCARACNNLGVVAWGDGHLEEALNWFYKALDLDSQDPEILRNSAQVLAEAGESDTALDLMEIYLRRHPEDENGWREYKQTLQQRGSCWQPNGFDVSVGEIYLRTGVSLADAGDLQGAGEALGRAAMLCQDRPEPFYQLGLLHLELEQTMDAIEMFREAVRINPDYRDAVQALAKSLFKGEFADEARELLEHYLSAHGGDDEMALMLEEDTADEQRGAA